MNNGGILRVSDCFIGGKKARLITRITYDRNAGYSAAPTGYPWEIIIDGTTTAQGFADTESDAWRQLTEQVKQLRQAARKKTR